MKCANPKCRHRIERHEILSSGKVFCQDCECRDYLVTQLIKDSAFCIDHNFWDEFEAARAAAHEVIELDRECLQFDLTQRTNWSEAAKAAQDAVEEERRQRLNFIEGDQWTDEDYMS